MNTDKNNSPKKDPLYAWLEEEAKKVFDFLVEEHSYVLHESISNKIGCWLTYIRSRTEIQLWTEMGGRPEIDVLEDGHRKSLNRLIKERIPEKRLPPRPEYTNIENEKKDFVMVLGFYASALKTLIK
jgi:hypothetical protein